ncbi:MULTISPECIES: hypothetical protein [unclassified Saccharopolyspora]|uniref:hypothetical protein n=1 Tax=unclassified Saccharopolyspora TaxID=2646250 RepID=UPI001CD7FC84|nr:MULTISPECIES: hypothetical protein [unclassified Saccharopolyspora]MCA1186180.1 hypothetical protein [Saccharopolyspora sp. 6T]MCA1278383.1 hypothetical protein [Saccharopolyspora sp. 7B]
MVQAGESGPDGQCVAGQDGAAAVDCDEAVFEEAVATEEAGEHADVVEVLALVLGAFRALLDVGSDEEVGL